MTYGADDMKEFVHLDTYYKIEDNRLKALRTNEINETIKKFIVENNAVVFCQYKDFDTKCLVCGNTEDLLIHKGDGENIIGCDIIAYYCPKCRKTVYFSDVKFKTYKRRN